MELNLKEIHNRFIEIVARSLDIRDQEMEGIMMYQFDHKRWRVRYHGRPLDEMPPRTVEYNTFRPVVDMVVVQLITALDDELWEAATKPIPGLTKEG